MTLVLGVDGCHGGWCCVPIDLGEDWLQVGEPAFYDSFERALATEASVVCVDIPIGLQDGPGHRACDLEARRLLGRGWPRVFPPPTRAVLSDDELADFLAGAPVALGDVRRLHRRACAVNQEAAGVMINLQSFYIAPKVYEVDSLVGAGIQGRVREVHPEVCFWALNGGSTLHSNKKTAAGRQERWRLLRRVLSALPLKPSLPAAIRSRCALDDYIDALACAWTAVCIARGAATSIPSPVELDARGLRMEMWLPAVTPIRRPARPGPAARRPR